MIEDIVVEPMTEDFILWRCTHGGPLSCNTIDEWSPDDSKRGRGSRLNIEHLAINPREYGHPREAGVMSRHLTFAESPMNTG